MTGRETSKMLAWIIGGILGIVLTIHATASLGNLLQIVDYVVRLWG